LNLQSTILTGGDFHCIQNNIMTAHHDKFDALFCIPLMDSMDLTTRLRKRIFVSASYVCTRLRMYNIISIDTSITAGSIAYYYTSYTNKQQQATFSFSF